MSTRQRRIAAGPRAGRSAGRHLQPTVLALGIALLLSAPAFAQEATTEAKEGDTPTELDAVVVTGIRGSVYRAQDIKRDADTFVDSVTALDIGALPDRSVTETLSRILAKLRQGGLIEVHGNHITIRNVQALRDIVHLPPKE